ncbi:MAG: DEAD/DEAH box helicase [Hoeflea sp.]|uniref:DEAD/DEAH box helicase n=1 Tax=Hoeflea sp. TaxID=1940281 RepID=UPI003EF39F3E
MPELDPERREIVSELRRQIASENELTANQARAFVRGLQTGWNVPTIQWSAAASREQYDDARRLLNAASILQSMDGRSSPEARLCYRRSAELLEWLSRAKDEIETSISLELLAAAAYQLGGSPAMAATLLVQAEAKSRGEKLYADFLRADFDGVIRSISIFWRDNPQFTNRDAQRQILEEDGEDKVGWLVTIELVRALGLISDTIRRGETNRFELAKRKLAALDDLATRIFSDEVSLLITLLHQVAIDYGEASIYVPIRQLSALKPERADRLERFARGQFSRGRGILWTSQRQGLARLLEDDSFALCTPTGSGKTLVANLALVKELLLKGDDDGPLALYLVPSRALAGEVEAKLSSELANDVIVTGLYGGTDWGVTDYWLDAEEPTVLIATVEKADALMRYLGPLLLRRIKLLIVDEAHQVVPENNERTQDDFAEHSSRSLRLEAFVSRLLSQVPDIVRIALTAVAGGAASPVARWIQGRDDAEPVGSNYRSTRQLIGSLETAPDRAGQMLLEILNGKPLFVRGRDEPVYINLRTPPMPQLPAVMRNSIYRFNQLDVLWTALHLASSGRRILISIAQQPEKTMGWYKDALSLQTWSNAPVFEPPADEGELRRFDDARAACVDYCGENSYEVALLDHGIASNHGQMPQRIRRMMVDLIDRGICPVTIATATLTEGVNLPFDIIFVPSLMRRSFNAVEEQQIENRMSTAEFRNLAGRAGRPGAGKGLEGITLVPIPTRPSTTAQGNLRTQRRQIATMQEHWRTLRQSLLAEELERFDIDSPLALLLNGIAQRAKELLDVDGEEFLGWLEAVVPPDISDKAGRASEDEMARLADSVDELDGVLLSALEELQRFDDAGLEGGAAEEALAAVWNKTFTVYAAAQEEWMEAAFISRGQAVLRDIYPDRDERSRLYQYGFTPYVGRRFEAIVPAMLEILRDAANYGDADEATRLSVFTELGELLSDDRGFGFRVRSTDTDQAILANWQGVLGWWMSALEFDAPDAKDLRVWQRFVSDNLDFRLGVGLGAVVARAWSDGVDGALVIPSLDAWRETTGLPWFGFWARELLRWGTLEPFVAFSLAEGLVGTRNEGVHLKQEFIKWLDEKETAIEAEDRIDPQLFLEWRRSRIEGPDDRIRRRSINVELDDTAGARGQYAVIPVAYDNVIHWLDAAGFSLAQSNIEDSPFQGLLHRDDFQLRTDRDQPTVRRTFSGFS